MAAANDKRLEPYSLWKRLKLKNKQKNAPTKSDQFMLV